MNSSPLLATAVELTNAAPFTRWKRLTHGLSWHESKDNCAVSYEILTFNESSDLLRIQLRENTEEVTVDTGEKFTQGRFAECFLRRVSSVLPPQPSTCSPKVRGQFNREHDFNPTPIICEERSINSELTAIDFVNWSVNDTIHNFLANISADRLANTYLMNWFEIMNRGDLHYELLTISSNSLEVVMYLGATFFFNDNDDLTSFQATSGRQFLLDRG